MPYSNTQAVVLSSMNYGEADRILTLLTYERGRVRVIVRGARRPRNRFAAMAQPLNLLEVQLTGNSNLETLSQGQLVNSYRIIKEDLLRLAYASYILELFDKATEGASDVAEVFIMLLTALELVRYSDDLHLVRMAVEMKLMTAIGYRLQLEYCIYCQDILDNTKPLHYNIAEGGFICERCKTSANTLACNPFGRELLLKMQKVSLIRFDTIADSSDRVAGKVHSAESGNRQEGLRQVDSILRESLRTHLGAIPKASEFLDEITRYVD